MGHLLFSWLSLSFIFSLVQGHIFDCFGKCRCYPDQKIIQCPTELRNQLGLSSKAAIEGFHVDDFKKANHPDFKELKVVPEGTFKPLTTRAPRKYGKSRPRRDMDSWNRFKAWLIDFQRKIQNMSRRH